VWDREGADWYGRSVLRAIHREFDIKDRLIKVDAVKHQRNGMGVPIPHVTDQSVGKTRAGRGAEDGDALRAGEDAGGVMPYGIDMRIKGVQGNLPDTLASIKEHNEAMARRFHAMFMMLGQTSHGSRALGEQFVDFFALNTDGSRGWIAACSPDHVVERWVDWNYGPDERAPQARQRARSETPEIDVADILTAVQSGALTAWTRARAVAPRPVRPAGPRPERAAAGGSRGGSLPRPAAAAASGDVKLPDRPLRRQPNATRPPPAVDFAAIEQAYVDAVDELAPASTRCAPTRSPTSSRRSRRPATTSSARPDQHGPGRSGADRRERCARSPRPARWTRCSEARHQGVTVDEIDLAGAGGRDRRAGGRCRADARRRREQHRRARRGPPVAARPAWRATSPTA
jgi:hypothetical protein